MPIERQPIDDILTDLFFRYEDALAKSDLVKLEEFFESEIKFIKIGMKGQRQGLDALRAHHMQLFERSHSGADVCFRETISLKVMSFGEDAGVTQSEFVDTFLPHGYQCVQTLLWQKFPSDWKIVAIHESVEVDTQDLMVNGIAGFVRDKSQKKIAGVSKGLGNDQP